MKLLFVSNGHGEAAIADRIAREVRSLVPGAQCDHLALVGVAHSTHMRDVGPQRAMPSGGIVAMGNVPNILRDLRSGLVALTLEQRRFLVRSRRAYAAAIAVGDVYALLMTLAVRVPTIYVGTAKSVLVTPYGPFEERVLKRAQSIFVRDVATAERLRARGVPAEAPGNVIVDLFVGVDDDRADRALGGFDPALALFPGSRESAYADAEFLLGVVDTCAQTYPTLGAAMSVAPSLCADRFVERFRARGYSVETHDDALVPFVVKSGQRALLRAWRGEIGPLLQRVGMVIGQAGTANEGAAAAGLPVVAFELGRDRKTAWYRMRQRGLLGDALLIAPGEPGAAARDVVDLLGDAPRRERMGALGRLRMGGSGGAIAIATRLASVIDAA